jgi:hypothetical protein
MTLNPIQALTYNIAGLQTRCGANMAIRLAASSSNLQRIIKPMGNRDGSNVMVVGTR